MSSRWFGPDESVAVVLTVNGTEVQALTAPLISYGIAAHPLGL